MSIIDYSANGGAVVYEFIWDQQSVNTFAMKKIGNNMAYVIVRNMLVNAWTIKTSVEPNIIYVMKVDVNGNFYLERFDYPLVITYDDGENVYITVNGTIYPSPVSNTTSAYNNLLFAALSFHLYIPHTP
jgi:hypothetical protein